MSIKTYIESSVSYKIILLLLFFLIIIALLGIGSYFELNRKDESVLDETRKLKDLVICESIAYLEELGSNIIKQKATDVARQLDIYIKAHPSKTIVDLQQDKYFKDIAVQTIGTGYTAVHDDRGINYFHTNPKIVGMDLHNLKEKLPGFWKIVEKSLKEDADGYYNWEDIDGKIRSKYMYIKKVETPTADNVFLRLAATTYIDEYSRPIKVAKELTEKTEDTTVNVKKLLSSKYYALIVILFFIILIELITFLYIHDQFVHPLKNLSEIATKASKGRVNIIVDVKSLDEFGQIGNALNKMITRLNKSYTSITTEVKEKTSLEGKLENLEQIEKTKMDEVELKMLRERELKIKELKKSLLQTHNKIRELLKALKD